jgi:peptide deformylase
MIRPILKYGDQTLHEAAQRVDALSPAVGSLISDMIDTMYAAPGIGLAAPQIGVPLRIFVVDISLGHDPAGLIVMVNPEFVLREGCSSKKKAVSVCQASMRRSSGPNGRS